MTKKEATQLLAHIVAVHPWVKLDKNTPAAWADLLRDVTFEEAQAAVRLRLALDDRPPSVAAVRASVVEKRLALPTSYQAWWEVERRANWRAKSVGCVGCGGRGFADLEAGTLCTACGGAGDHLDFKGEPPVHPLARQAADRVGGLVAIRASDDRTWIRRDFLKAFDELRDGEVVRENERTLTSPSALSASDALLSS